MMNELQIFKNVEFGNVRVIEINGEAWLVGKDVVERLGYDLSTNSYTFYINKFVDSEDKLKCDSQSSFGINYKSLGQRGGYLINESGLYSLTINSKLPSAKKFKRWVTNEVLPSIRKHGVYMTDEILEKTIANPDFMINLLQNLKAEKQARQLAESKLEEVQPKVTYHDVVLNNESFFPITNIAKDLGMTANKLNTYLSELHVQYKRSKEWILYKNYDWLITSGYADYKETQYGNQLKWSSKGKKFIIKLLSESKYNSLLPKEYLSLDLNEVVMGGIA